MKGLSTHSNVFSFLLSLFDKCKKFFDHTLSITLGQVDGLWHGRERLLTPTRPDLEQTSRLSSTHETQAAGSDSEGQDIAAHPGK